MYKGMRNCLPKSRMLCVLHGTTMTRTARTIPIIWSVSLFDASPIGITIAAIDKVVKMVS